MGKPYRTIIDHSGDPPKANAPVAEGDSLALHLKKNNGLNGNPVPGATPSAILAKIQQNQAANPHAYQGNVVLSSGATNDPTEVELVHQQIQTLKGAGATVVLIGVGPGRDDALKNKDINGTLKRIASEEGAAFVQAPESAFVEWDKYREHISPEANKALYRSVQTSFDTAHTALVSETKMTPPKLYQAPIAP